MKDIEILIQNGQLEEAIKTFLSFLQQENSDEGRLLYQKVLHLSSRYNSLITENKKGKIGRNELNIDRNQIIDTLIENLNEAKEAIPFRDDETKNITEASIAKGKMHSKKIGILLFIFILVATSVLVFKVSSIKKETFEEPIHSVNLNDFSISSYEVNYQQWEEIMGKKLNSSAGCPECPVTNISREDAQKFAELLSTMTGKGYRLPSEKEWEDAATDNKQQGSLSQKEDYNVLNIY